MNFKIVCEKGLKYSYKFFQLRFKFLIKNRTTFSIDLFNFVGLSRYRNSILNSPSHLALIKSSNFVLYHLS